MFVPLLLLVCISSSFAADSDSANEVDPKPPIQLDPALRRALLKAIENLENETEADENAYSTESSTTEENEILATGDDIQSRNKQDDSSSDQVPAIQYHSFVVDGHKAFENNSKSESNNDNGEVESVTYKGLDPILVEDIETKETSFNTLTQTRSIQNNIVAENDVKSESKDVSRKPEVVTKKPTTTTTTTTTPRPKYNEDGENIEELDNHEVQVFQAPLVAAFTVHQDAQGLPRSVVPIYKQAVRKPITPALPVSRMQLGNKFQSNDNSLKQQNTDSQSQIIQQFALQQQIEQKQRLLEEQIQKLQSQQKQHEELLRQQHLQHQQQLLYSQNEQQRQQQQQRLFEEQRLRQQYAEQQRTSQNFIQPFRQQPFQKNLPSQTSVSFQPSISFSPSEQQLPQREAVDFLLRLRSGQQSSFPLQQSPQLVPPSNQLQLPVEKPFTANFVDKGRQNNINLNNPNNLNNLNNPNNPNNNNNNLNNLNNNNNVRVFRHDSSTGNFGINTNNGFNRNYQFSNNFRNIPLSPHHNRYAHDNELQSLLLQSGLAQSGRSQEDLSIVSKVLSLNHGVNFRNNFLNGNPNIHFGESKRIDARTKPNFN